MTTEVELTNPLRSVGVCQGISCRPGELRLPRQGQGSTFRTRAEQGPRFDRAWNPPNPKLREVDGHFIPTSAYLEEVECSLSEMCGIALETGFDDA
jgi:hypothetical protein